jgi:hypothetical protein
MKDNVIYIDFAVEQATVENRRNSEVLLSRGRVIAVYCDGRVFVINDYEKSEWRYIRRFIESRGMGVDDNEVSYNPLEFLIAVIEATE